MNGFLKWVRGRFKWLLNMYAFRVALELEGPKVVSYADIIYESINYNSIIE